MRTCSAPVHPERTQDRSGSHPAGTPRGAPGRVACRRPTGGPARTRLACADTPARTTSQEDTIATDKAASWVYAEGFAPEDDTLLRARDRAGELGCTAVAPGTGAALSVLAAAVRARAVVEVGTGAGVSGLHLLRGMPSDGVLTTIDVEVEHQRAAKQAFAEEGVRPARTRTISGRALDVLPRLTDGAYDLVFVDADIEGYPSYVDQAVRLLRPGGVLAVDDALWHDRVADPARRDEATTIVRETGRKVRDDDRLLPALLPVGDGLLVAVRR
ncbi:Putative O-methyltransferase [Cellulomonas hominis]|nr:Putative O-methyltransferase [Cellulomonas hominis]